MAKIDNVYTSISMQDLRHWRAMQGHLVHQHLRINAQLKVRQEAEADLQFSQFLLTDPANLCNATVRPAEVFQRLGRNLETGKDKPVDILGRHAEHFFHHGHPGDVEARRDEDGGRHGAVPVQSQQVVLERNGRHILRQELARQQRQLEDFLAGPVGPVPGLPAMEAQRLAGLIIRGCFVTRRGRDGLICGG